MQLSYYIKEIYKFIVASFVFLLFFNCGTVRLDKQNDNNINNKIFDLKFLSQHPHYENKDSTQFTTTYPYLNLKHQIKNDSFFIHIKDKIKYKNRFQTKNNICFFLKKFSRITSF
ncbi:MAG: hypothetical protein ACI94Y_000084 [Maribacter sp.]|jgi:hypothetical protein